MALRWEMGWPNEIKGFDKRPHKLYKCQTCPAPVILQCFPWDLPYISLSEMSAGVDLSDWSQEGAFWMNEEQKSKWEHNAKGTRKGLAGSTRAKPSACVLFLSEWQRGHFHGMSWGAWVYPAKPLLPQGLWALWSLCPSCIHPVLYSLPQISLSTPLAALTQLSVFIQPHPPLRQPNKAPLVRPSLLLARHSRDSQHWKEWVKRTHAVQSHLIACCFLSIKL